MRSAIAFGGIALLLAPIVVFAFPFGGQIRQVIPCYNQAIYAYLGPPIGGPYLWVSGSTKTYQYGPPAFVGQWLLGLAAPPYYCIVSISPLHTESGTAITMMGSSGPSSPTGTYVSQNGQAGFSAQPSTGVYQALLNSGASGYSGGSSGSLGGSSLIGHIIISEVFYNVDAAHGSKPENEWVELYNASNVPVDISGWNITDDVASSTLPSGTTVAAGGYVIVSDSNSTTAKWTIPTTAKFISLGISIGNGLANPGDVVRLKNTSGTTLDEVSWGSNTSAFNPSAPVVAAGHSIIRKTLASDTNAASDWVDTPAPTPGR